MASATATARLQRELRDIVKDPPPHVRARPNPANILEWHYILEGPPGTPYAGGQYHGKLLFPSGYPFKPPSVVMLTPNGRFKPNARICMSMSDYHPESWNPLWSVGSILTGLLSFMCDSATTAGSIQTTDAEKEELARHSAAYNSKNPSFKKIFPDFVGGEKGEANKARSPHDEGEPRGSEGSPGASASQPAKEFSAKLQGKNRSGSESERKDASDGDCDHGAGRPPRSPTMAYVLLGMSVLVAGFALVCQLLWTTS